jgi:hypothetical protein
MPVFSSNCCSEQLSKQELGCVLLTNTWRDACETADIEKLFKHKQCHVSPVADFVENYRVTSEPICSSRPYVGSVLTNCPHL